MSLALSSSAVLLVHLPVFGWLWLRLATLRSDVSMGLHRVCNWDWQSCCPDAMLGSSAAERRHF